MKNFLKISLLISVFFYILYDIDYNLFFLNISNYSILGIIFMLILVILPEVIFAYRWIYATNENYNVLEALKAHTLAGIAGLVAPMKLGELAPIWYLQKIHGVKTYSTFATTIIVRMIDLVVLLSLGLLVTFLVFNNSDYQIYSLVLLITLWIIIVVFFKYPKIAFVVCKFIPNRKLNAYLIKLIRIILHTIKLKNLTFLLIFTTLLWISFFAVTFVFLFYVAKFDLSIIDFFVVFLVTSVGMAIPLAPSGFATYHASMILSLGWYGISKDSALGAAIVLHVIQLSPSVVLYIVFFLFTKNKNILWRINDKKIM